MPTICQQNILPISNMTHIISSILPIFIITLLGKFIKSYWLKSDEFWRGLESLSYFLLFPVVLFNYIVDADISSMHLLRLVFALMIATSIVGAILLILQKKYNIDNQVFTSIFQGSIRYNSYIFFALGDALYSKEGMIIVSVISAYMIIFTNVLSVSIFSIYTPLKEEDKLKGFSQWGFMLKNITTNPLILASIVGFFFNYLDITLAVSVHKTLQTLSSSALAIGILCVGTSLSLNLSSSFNNLVIGLSCIMKLFVLPAITFVVFKLLGIKGLAHSIGLLYSSLPTATNSYFLSKQLGGDTESMSTIITFTIIFSILSLTLLTYIFA